MMETLAVVLAITVLAQSIVAGVLIAALGCCSYWLLKMRKDLDALDETVSAFLGAAGVPEKKG